MMEAEKRERKWSRMKIFCRWTFWTLPLPYNESQADHDVCKKTEQEKQQKLQGFVQSIERVHSNVFFVSYREV
jgi:hypothetical protein